MRLTFSARRLLAGIAVTTVALFAGCGMEASNDARAARGELGETLDDVPYAKTAEPEAFACANWLQATDQSPGGYCLKPLDASMTCSTCKITFRAKASPEDYINDPAQIAEEIKKQIEASMRKSLEEGGVKEAAEIDRLIEALKNDKDSNGKNPIDRIADNERLKWESQKKQIDDVVGQMGEKKAKERLATLGLDSKLTYLKPGLAPLALPLLVCPNPDCKQPIDPMQSRCRSCKQHYQVEPRDLALAVKEPLEALCPSCKKPVDPTSNLCRNPSCDKLFRTDVSSEGPCWRCGGARYCTECGGSGNSVAPPGTDLPICWACQPQTATGDPTTVRGDGFCAECGGKGFIDYDPALPKDWSHVARGKWKLQSGEAAATKPEGGAGGDEKKPEKSE